MKRLFSFFLPALMILCALSCNKDNSLGGRVPKPKAIDMGMELTRKDGTKYNLKWANCNLGASKEYQAGNYYAWGETEPKSFYSWENYKWCAGLEEDDFRFTKYEQTSGSVILETGPKGDDVVSKKLGGRWRMPTKEEWGELSTYTWTKEERNGVAGCVVTAKNGNSIFLPVAGLFEYSLTQNGSWGYYWSSSLGTGDPEWAWRIDFGDGDGDVGLDLCSRCGGQSVRPVYED